MFTRAARSPLLDAPTSSAKLGLAWLDGANRPPAPIRRRRTKWWVTTHPSMKARCMSTSVFPGSTCRVTIPVFYPSLGAGLAQVGAFEIVMTAPSTDEWAHRPTQGWDERVITSTGPRHCSFLHTLKRQASRAASDGTASGPIDWPPPPPPDTWACRDPSAPGQTSSSRGRTG